jgi:hypothetical protein
MYIVATVTLVNTRQLVLRQKISIIVDDTVQNGRLNLNLAVPANHAQLFPC